MTNKIITIKGLIEFVTVDKDAVIVIGKNVDASDRYHSINELYDHRMMLNAALFNLIQMISDWDSADETGFNYEFKVMKSKQHYDGSMFDGYFIVMLLTPKGQISYHYKLEYWNLFQIPEVERTPEYDGHKSEDVLARLVQF